MHTCGGTKARTQGLGPRVATAVFIGCPTLHVCFAPQGCVGAYCPHMCAKQTLSPHRRSEPIIIYIGTLAGAADGAREPQDIGVLLSAYRTRTVSAETSLGWTPTRRRLRRRRTIWRRMTCCRRYALGGPYRRPTVRAASGSARHAWWSGHA